MKKYFLIFVFIISHFLAFSQKEKIVATTDGICNEEQWELTFEDNFDGNSINLNLWKDRENNQGSLDYEGSEEYYSFKNVTVENGLCKLIPKKETVERKAISWKADTALAYDKKINLRTYHYTSGWIESKQQFKYGKYEIRCKIPKGKGLWPAFWMYGQNGDVNNEIDVFEFWNPENWLGKYSSKKLSMEHHMTIHFNHKMSGKNYTGPDYSLDFHTFTVVWDSTKIVWYVDGEIKRLQTKYLTKRGKNVECKDVKTNNTYYLNPVFPKEFMNIQANIAVQSGKNSPNEETFNNCVYEIDYIRYYKPMK